MCKEMTDLVVMPRAFLCKSDGAGVVCVECSGIHLYPSSRRMPLKKTTPLTDSMAAYISASVELYDYLLLLASGMEDACVLAEGEVEAQVRFLV